MYHRLQRFQTVALLHIPDKQAALLSLSTKPQQLFLFLARVGKYLVWPHTDYEICVCEVSESRNLLQGDTCMMKDANGMCMVSIFTLYTP